MEKFEIIVVAALSAYELLSRIVPTNKTWSLIGILLRVLKAISDLFDNKKEKK